MSDTEGNLEKVKGTFAQGRVVAEHRGAAKALHTKSRFGEVKDDKVNYSFIEAFYLFEQNKLEIKEGRKKVTKKQLLQRAEQKEKNFWVRYCVFRELRSRGYIVKTALKFGADFRVYDKGVKPGEDHARWIVFPVKESETLTWYELSAKNRVAHSTRKHLLIGVVDEEDDVTFYESQWIRP